MLKTVAALVILVVAMTVAYFALLEFVLNRRPNRREGERRRVENRLADRRRPKQPWEGAERRDGERRRSDRRVLERRAYAVA